MENTPSAHHHNVMISSTWLELRDHRAAVSSAVLGQGMFPLDMANDASLPHDLIEASLAKVNKAHAYIGLISYRYGQIVDDPIRNPNGLSLTELEYRRAVERGIPRCMFTMHDDHTPGIPRSMVNAARPTEDKLNAFIALVRKDLICAEFRSVDNLKALAVQSLTELAKTLDRPTPPDEPEAFAPTPSTIPASPAFYAHPPYLPGNKFHGRASELTALRDWAGATEPMMLFEAIGGMGKSMVTWEWITNHADQDRPGWAGLFWYSFYERGADMGDFCVTALTYITGRPRQEFVTRPIRDLAEELLRHLREQRYLLVLDGLERVLAAYNRSDAAQLSDDEAEESLGATGKSPIDCIRPDDDEFLGWLRTAAPSKILISSRLMPRALLNAFGQPVPGVRHTMLRGLDPRDAEQMLRDAGIDGNSDQMRRYLEERFGCHPLLVGIVGGLVLKYMRAPGHFDIWVDDPSDGGAVNLANPDIEKRRKHILKLAFDGLDGMTHQLLTRIAMISTTVAWDVLAALNPALPPQPEAVEQPVPPDIEGDMQLKVLRHRLAGTVMQQQRFRLLQEIAARHRVLERPTEVIRRAYAAYQASLTAYRQSAAVRTAERWLNAALTDLETRGLLQCNRQTGMFDLHPVVRGYAIASLSPTLRALTGQRVADYFASRPEPAFEAAESLQDLIIPMQIVQTLNLAGTTKEAWAALKGDLFRALYRLERYHELLALLRPLFPRGWLAPPEGVEDPDHVANLAALALVAVGLSDEAVAQQIFFIQESIRKGVSVNLSISLKIYAATFWQRLSVDRAEQILTLARAVAVAAEDTNLTFSCDLELVNCRRNRGAVADARAGWSRLSEHLSKETGNDSQLEAQALIHEASLLFDEGALTAETLGSAIGRAHDLRQPFFERSLLRLSGHWHLANARSEAAEADFARAIEMARAAGLSDTESEAGRGLALARLGGPADAASAAAAASAERDPPSATLAELYLTLGDHDKARHHALAGYKRYWADGPPYTVHWKLQRCRAVLEQLHEPVPEMPAYDPSKMEPFPFEADILRLLKEHEAKKT
ncbi:MAG: DUF4062 domain-containing protein [Acetobacteraceae bacterium]|nr:DUF4062 domain-containing protein [Acetobacteraceae bacterium]